MSGFLMYNKNKNTRRIKMKYEWRKQEKDLYAPKQKKPVIVDVPKQKFIIINGEGNPNESDFSDRISALYSLAYAIKMFFKNMSKTKADNETTDFTVYPLEGIWKKADGEGFDKDKLKYRLMIKQPDFIKKDVFTEAFNNVKKKKPNILYDEISFEEIEDGKSIQILHIGSYDNEPESFEMMDKLANESNLARTADYPREIYLTSKAAAKKQKTILRYMVGINNIG